MTTATEYVLGTDLDERERLGLQHRLWADVDQGLWMRAGIAVGPGCSTSHQRVARGGDPLFAWPDTWWRSFAPKLVTMGRITQAQCDELFADLDAIRRSETDFIVSPPVTEILAVKTRG
jgi:hypothetical protein